MLPHADIRLRHEALFRVPAEPAFRAARDLDVLRHPLARALIAARALPLGGTGPPTLRIGDLSGPTYGWSVLGERSGAELVLGTVARPWKVTTPPAAQPATPDEFTTFTAPGHVKIVLAVQAVPQGPAATVLTIETRVAATDAASARRFHRYWRLVGPFSELIRRTALRMLARELDPPARNGGDIVIARPVETVFDAVADERTEPHYNPQVRNVQLLTPEPLGVGTRFHAEAVTAARPAPMTIECTGYDRPHRFDSTTRMAAMDIDYTLTFEPAAHALAVRPPAPRRAAAPAARPDRDRPPPGTAQLTLSFRWRRTTVVLPSLHNGAVQRRPAACRGCWRGRCAGRRCGRGAARCGRRSPRR